MHGSKVVPYQSINTTTHGRIPGKKRRVRNLTLRGVFSDGIWVPWSDFEWTGAEPPKPETELTSLAGHELCKKYLSPQTQKLQTQANKKRKKERPKYPSGLKKHYNTTQLRTNFKKIPHNSLIVVTEKLHGTSGRTGHIIEKKPFTGLFAFLKRWWYGKGFYLAKEYVTGTRRTIIHPSSDSINLRQYWHNRIKEAGLYLGETIYYELVGFNPNGKPIMDVHGIQDKKLQKKYGPAMIYSYGCDPGGNKGKPQNRLFVYRITQTTPDNRVIDLTTEQTLQRARELGLEHVPVLRTTWYDELDKPTNLLKEAALLANSHPSTLDPTHIREGIVLNFQHPEHINPVASKYKSDVFCELEGIAKNSSSFFDPEEGEEDATA